MRKTYLRMEQHDLPVVGGCKITRDDVLCLVVVQRRAGSRRFAGGTAEGVGEAMSRCRTFFHGFLS
jgi:hypothetical protein